MSDKQRIEMADKKVVLQSLKFQCQGSDVFRDVWCGNIATHFDVAGHRAYLCDACFARAVAQVMQDGTLIWDIPF